MNTDNHETERVDLWEARAKALLDVLKAAMACVGDITIRDIRGRILVDSDAYDELDTKIRKYLATCNPVTEDSHPMFYIVSLERSRSAGCAIFWYPNGAGYTLDFGKAGLFSQEDCDRVKHNKELLFVPKDKLSQDDTVAIVPFVTVKERFAVA